MKIKNTEIKIVKADITELKVDAIVNAANNQLLMGGGVAGIIKKKGGPEIEAEAVKKGPIDIGGAVWTKAGRLPSKYVIHAATMAMDFKTDEHKIRNSCASALTCAKELKIKSIAFPALGCGVGRFPAIGAAKIMAQEVLKHLRQSTPLQEIIFCLYDDEMYKIFDKQVQGYLKHVAEDMGQGPYVTVDIIIELSAHSFNKSGRDLAKIKNFGGKEGIVLIERSNPPYGWALPGGFVDYGETLEESAIREAKEETNLDLKNLRQFRTYSDPTRDPRFHTISTVFIAQAQGTPKAGDDAQGLKIVSYSDLLKCDYAFDHKKIISDYLKDIKQ